MAKVFVENPKQLHVDGQDAWPRYYFDFQCARKEVESWLVERGEKPWTTLQRELNGGGRE